MNIINNESQPIITPLGRALHNARLAASLSLEEVALQLNLNVSTVKDLEIELPETIENKKYATIYLRGYLTNYARLVCLSPLDQYIEYQQLSKPDKNTVQLRNTASANTSSKKRSKFITPILIGICVIIVAGIAVQQLWLSDELPESAALSDSILSTKANVQVVTEVAKTDTISKNDTISETETETATTSEVDKIAVATAQPSAEVEEIQSVDTKTEPVEPLIVQTEPQIIAPATVINTSDSTTAEISITNGVAERITNNNDIIDTGESISNETISNEVIVAESLKLSFSGDSWTEIFDATGERLAFGLYTDGSVLTVSGREPFQLKLGDPSVVEIHYQDQKIERELPAGRTARLTIPE